MNWAIYFDCIEERLNFVAFRIEMRGGLNLLDLHLHSEDFYLHFFNLLFGLNLKNLNTVDQNAPAIDLADTGNKTIIQVSSTATKQKIDSALAKNLSPYKGYAFKFISISKDATDLKTKTFANPHALTFSPATDIYDIPTLLRVIHALHIDQLKAVNDFIRKELRSVVEPINIESNLASIIKILAQEDWNHTPVNHPTTPFDIAEKIVHNHLDRATTVIDEYKVHHARLDRLYTEFDKEGANKSLSILNGIRKQYLEAPPGADPDARFFLVIKNLCARTQESANYTPIPGEELELCVGILVVDAFIRCKIFKNPLGQGNVNS